MRTSKEDCLEALKESARILGTSPTKADYEELGLTPASGTIIRVMGGWNAAKEAAGLETYTQSEGWDVPIVPKPDDVEIPDDEDWTTLNPQQRWYYKNKERRIAVKNRRKRSIRRWLYEFKRDKCTCERCGASNPACLDFHHEGTKDADVSRMVNHGYSIKNIKAEIDRCNVLCANCHQYAHFGPPSSREDGMGSRCESNGDAEPEWRRTATEKNQGKTLSRREKLRDWIYEYKRSSGGCENCNEDKPTCLEFHHVDEFKKTESISRLISHNPSNSRLLDEIEKCELLCRNCHRKEHYHVPSVPLESRQRGPEN